ncbi:hypothetical protein AMS68_000480 [Peltaster fructicola]|uniref:Uncharacterized protein n=1 Tax=Peltaster fructicola TaxID=286661 RepID=A0A6H0XJQ2_9PEZI|nr:hypothetical protein AMS68_000480 [Peltaster fructicola]
MSTTTLTNTLSNYKVYTVDVTSGPSVKLTSVTSSTATLSGNAALYLSYGAPEFSLTFYKRGSPAVVFTPTTSGTASARASLPSFGTTDSSGNLVAVTPGAEDLSLEPGILLYALYNAGATSLDAGSLSNSLASALTTLQTSPSSASPSASSSVVSASVSSTSKDNLSSSSGVTSSDTTTPAASATSSGNSTISATSPGIPAGAVAGAAIGALVFGCLLGILILYCCCASRLKKQETKMDPPYPVISRKAVPGASIKEKDWGTDSVTDLERWRKHLPQEADDNTISKDARKTFDLINIHIDSYYAPRENPPKEILTAIAAATSTDLVKIFARGLADRQLLEAIAARWITHRISLYSKPEDSLLPVEYTVIPKRNGWHMESEKRESCARVEKGVGGFFPAFSQWRVLTSFLSHIMRDKDIAFQKAATAKIERAIVDLEALLKFWEISGANPSDRRQGLREILAHAAKTGEMLFRQPAIFEFDWSPRAGSPERTIVIYPVLRRNLDELGRPLPQERGLTECIQKSYT